MQAELRGFYNNDSPELDLESFAPDDRENFGVSVRAFIGPKDGPGEEMFDSSSAPRAGWLLTRWDFGVLDRALRDLAAHTRGETWEEVATKLSRWGRWEFEDYSDP